MNCPHCGHKNIVGADNCDSCHNDLTSLSAPLAKSKIEKVLMSDPVSKLKGKTPITILGTATVQEAVHLMTKEKIGTVLVVDRMGDLEGILSEYDIVFKAMSEEKDLSTLSVSSIMTGDPETLSSDASLAFAINKMAIGGFRHVPIVNLESARPIGLISVRDVLRYISKVFT